MIHHTCFKCKRRFELDPAFVGFELSKLKKKNPSHYQAICPACRVANKISVKQMQAELDEAAGDVQVMVAEFEQNKAQAKAEKQAKAKTGTGTQLGEKKRKARVRAKATRN